MATSMHFGATKKTFKFACELRNNLTVAEVLLWQKLRKNSLGYKFRQQHPIWRFIVDFYCHDLKLIIELDGSIHALEEIKLNDQDREAILKNFGLRIIRFSNDQVLNDTNMVVSEIMNVISEIKHI